MVLNRNYSMNTNKQIEDLTTYIDPVKFNYIFADTNNITWFCYFDSDISVSK